MRYYIITEKDGTPIGKHETALEFFDSQHKEVTKEEFDAYSVEKEKSIINAKKLLAESDYIACKIAEGAATKEEYKAELEDRQKLRLLVNELEGTTVV